MKSEDEFTKCSKKMTRSEKRYQSYLEFGDGFDTFVDFCHWYDSQKIESVLSWIEKAKLESSANAEGGRDEA